MRRRVVVAAAVAVTVAGMLMIAAATTFASEPPESRSAGQHFLVPQDLAWRYVTSCMADADGPSEISISADGTASASVIDAGGERSADPETEVCLNRYRYETASSFQYVSAYERAQLFDWYTGETKPCLEALGVTAPDVDRAQFFVPDERVWNPYTSMDDVPFDELVGLYRACPPVPAYLLARHVS